MAVLPPDIVCFYTDLGRPYYPLLKRMTESAGDICKGSRRILLSPNPNKAISALFDETFTVPLEPTWNKLCLNKANSFMSWAQTAERRMIFADPDLEFKREPEFTDDFDVAVSWRHTRPDQPVNMGMVLARPGTPKFWKQYGAIVSYLPSVIHPWWCDQLGFSIILGTDHNAWDCIKVYDARVKLIPMAQMCAPLDKASPDVWAIHYKGARKGSEWEQFFGRKKPRLEVA